MSTTIRQRLSDSEFPLKGASWTLRHRHADRDKWFALGNYPDMSLAEARAAARAARVLLDKGLDPMAEKRAMLQAARRRKSFRQLAENWYVAEIEARVKHPEVARRHLDNTMLPALGSTPASDVTAHDVARMLERIRADHPTAANDLLRYTKRVLDFGVRRHALQHSAAATLSPRRDAGGIEQPRTRALSEDELKTLFKKYRGAAVGNRRLGSEARRRVG